VLEIFYAATREIVNEKFKF
jgi:hypothetical protein